jgi:type VI protein secretion system component VasK
MTPGRLVTLIVLVVFAAVTLQPAPAEALEPTTVLLIVGGAVIVVALVALLVIANIRERQRGEAEAPAPLSGVLLAQAP